MEPAPESADVLLAAPTQVTVTITNAVELPACDANGLSDPYCEVSVRQRVGGAAKGKTKIAKSIIHKTKVVKKSLNPVWSETFMLSDNLKSVETSHVAFKIWDEDRMSNDFIGECRLELADVVSQPGCARAAATCWYRHAGRVGGFPACEARK